jgi:hypothetical protein
LQIFYLSDLNKLNPPHHTSLSFNNLAIMKDKMLLYIDLCRLFYVVFVITRRLYSSALQPILIVLDHTYSPKCSLSQSNSSLQPYDEAYSLIQSSYFTSKVCMVCMYNMNLMKIASPRQRLSKKSKHKLEYKHGKHK